MTPREILVQVAIWSNVTLWSLVLLGLFGYKIRDGLVTISEWRPRVPRLRRGPKHKAEKKGSVQSGT